MGPRVWLPPLVAALLASLVTAWLLRPAPPPPPRDDDARADLQYLERRLAAIERAFEERTGQATPVTAAAPTTPPPPREPTLKAPPPKPIKPEEPTASVPSVVAGPHEWTLQLPREARTGVDAAELRRLKELREADALADVERLLSSRDAKERATAIEFLAGANGAAYVPVLRRAIEDAVRDGRRSDVGRLLHSVARTKDRAWSAKQLVGEPDTPIDGDLATAWASKNEDMGEVWIELDYERAVRPDAVRVFEPHNPGAVSKVLGKAPSGAWEVLWEGTERPGSAPWTSEIPLAGRSFATATIRIVLDTNRVGGWNEIDAVELVGDGLRQWAKDARASSSFAD
jgi:hypothetical protein